LAFMRHRARIPMLVGLSHADNPAAWPMEEIILALGYLSPYNRPPTVLVNALDSASVANALAALIEAYARDQVAQLSRL